MPSAVRIASRGTAARLCSASSWAFSVFLLGRAAHIAGMSRLSGSVVITLCSSRIAEMPSTSEWCIFVYSATRPSRMPSIRCASHSGRSRASRVLCSREQRSSSSRTRPGLGRALCRKWYSRSKLSSCVQAHWPARGDAAGRPLEEQRRDLVDLGHLLVDLAHVVARSALGLLEELQATDVHRHLPVLGEQECRRRRVHRNSHGAPPLTGVRILACLKPIEHPASEAAAPRRGIGSASGDVDHWEVP